MDQSLLLRTDEITWDWLERIPVWGKFADDDSEMWRPVVEHDPFSAQCAALKIRSRLCSADGNVFSGAISIERVFDGIYLIVIFSHGRRFLSNRYLLDLTERDRKALVSLIGNIGFQLFPLTYYTLMDRPGIEFSGIYDPFSPDNHGQGFVVKRTLD